MCYLSVITVSYNDKDGLIRTRDSILPLPNNCEWIIIDAASTDGTRMILEKLPMHKNIKWLSEPDAGIFDGMNKGIDLASGVYLNFMNSGDRFVRKSFESVCKKMPANADIIVYDCIVVDNNDNQGYARRFPESIDEIKYWACVQHQSALLKKTVFNKLGKYSLKYKYLSDYEHSVRAFLDNAISFHLDKNIKLAKFLQDGVSTNLNTASCVSKEYVAIQTKYFGNYSKRLYLTHLIKNFISFIPRGDIFVRGIRKIFLKKR